MSIPLSKLPFSNLCCIRTAIEGPQLATRKGSRKIVQQCNVKRGIMWSSPISQSFFCWTNHLQSLRETSHVFNPWLLPASSLTLLLESHWESCKCHGSAGCYNCGKCKSVAEHSDCHQMTLGHSGSHKYEDQSYITFSSTFVIWRLLNKYLLRKDYLYLHIIYAITFSPAFVVFALLNLPYEAFYGLSWHKCLLQRKIMKIVRYKRLHGFSSLFSSMLVHSETYILTIPIL